MSDRLNSSERVEIERSQTGAPLSTQELYAQAERHRAEHTAMLIRRAAAWLKGRIGRLAETMRNARLANELAALDDKTLADIGLHRSDLAAIAAGEDPRKESWLDKAPGAPATPAAPANDGGKIAA
jgi:uncharacterized protein YjiS (DUF1127 family)